MGVEPAAGATTCSELGSACDTGVTLSITLICAPFTADHGARAAGVPVMAISQVESTWMKNHTRCDLLEGAVLEHFNQNPFSLQIYHT